MVSQTEREKRKDDMASPLSLTEQLFAACLLECTAPKPGNVSPGISFDDVTYGDFVKSAEVSAPILAAAAQLGVGWAIRDAVRATRTAVGTNTNLGMLLLLAPLAAIPPGIRCSDGIAPVLHGIDVQQTHFIYEAIRLANPGGLGNAADQDVSAPPTIPILEAMALAPHDRIAWQYTHQFEDVLGTGTEVFLRAIQSGLTWKHAVVRLHLELIALHGDSLILRKCGPEIALEAQHRAQLALQSWPSESPAPEALIDFDNWLRADGHRRNPGTTADLTAAVLFAIIRDHLWGPPDVAELLAP